MSAVRGTARSNVDLTQTLSDQRPVMVVKDERSPLLKPLSPSEEIELFNADQYIRKAVREANKLRQRTPTKDNAILWYVKN